MEEEIAAHSREYWVERLSEHDISWDDVYQIDGGPSHPATDHLDIIRQIETEDGPIRFIDNPPQMSESDLRREKMPELSEDTLAVLEELGYTPEGVGHLKEEEAV